MLAPHQRCQRTGQPPSTSAGSAHVDRASLTVHSASGYRDNRLQLREIRMQSIALQPSLSDRKGNGADHSDSPNIGMLSQPNAMLWQANLNYNNPESETAVPLNFKSTNLIQAGAQDLLGATRQEHEMGFQLWCSALIRSACLPKWA